MTLASAKTSQRLLNDLPWPKTLVFASSYEICFCSFPQPFPDISPLSIVGEDPSTVEKLIQTRTFNISVIYPPTRKFIFYFFVFLLNRFGKWLGNILSVYPPGLLLSKLVPKKMCVRYSDFELWMIHLHVPFHLMRIRYLLPIIVS